MNVILLEVCRSPEIEKQTEIVFLVDFFERQEIAYVLLKIFFAYFVNLAEISPLLILGSVLRSTAEKPAVSSQPRIVSKVYI